jgi:anti-sigma B factor antagonist
MTESLLEVSTRTEDAGTTITVAGELDLTTLPMFLSAVDEALSDGVELVIIDTEQLTFADSSAIHALIHAQAVASDHDIELLLAHVTGSLRRTLTVAGVARAFEIIDN